MTLGRLDLAVLVAMVAFVAGQLVGDCQGHQRHERRGRILAVNGVPVDADRDSVALVIVGCRCNPRFGLEKEMALRVVRVR